MQNRNQSRCDERVDSRRSIVGRPEMVSRPPSKHLPCKMTLRSSPVQRLQSRATTAAAFADVITGTTSKSTMSRQLSIHFSSSAGSLHSITW